MLLSACIITLDEEANLPECLASLAGVVDEVVVYDTGSSDATRAVARSAGAVVVDGAWPGGFAAARNAALERCRGDWVLSIDADERLQCPDPPRLRSRLSGAPWRVPAFRIPIDNLTGVGLGSGYAHAANRIFRRQRCAWRGRLHEQVVDIHRGGLVPSVPLGDARLLHHGYVEGGDGPERIERNLTLARAEVDDPSLGDRGTALVWLGRALWAADRPEEALPALLEGATATANTTSRRQGLEAAARICLRLDRLGEAGPIIDDLRSASECQVVGDVLTAGLYLASGQSDEALSLLEPVADGVITDDDGREYGPRTVAEWTAAALVQSGRPGEAADLLLGSLRERAALDGDLDLVVEALERSGRSLEALAAAVPPSRLAPVLAAAVRLEPRRGHRVIDALWHRVAEGAPDLSATVLAGAALLGRVLDASTARVWSERLRQHGLAELCPLRAVAVDPTVPPARRLDAALTAVGLGDPADGLGIVAAIAGLDGNRREAVAGSPELRQFVEEAALRSRPRSRRAAPPPTRLDLSLVLTVRGGATARGGGVVETLGCLEALAATLPPSRRFEVIVVDVATTDATGALLAGLDGDVAVLRTAADIGTAKARNLGAEAAAGPTVVFVDPVARPRVGWLDPLLAVLEDPGPDNRYGAVVPLLVDQRNRVRSAGAEVVFARPDPEPAGGLARCPWAAARPPEVSTLWHHGGHIGPEGVARDGVVPVDAGAGAVLAVRRDALSAVGGFDESYWNGGDELDLCFRLRAAGWAVGCEPASQIEVSRECDPSIAPWAPEDPRRVPFTDGVGLRWQLHDNRRRFLERWGSSRAPA